MREFPVRGGRVTTGFWDLRPYSKPVEERTYVHRAWDLSGGTGEIVAPEDGEIHYHVITRCPLTRKTDQYWPDSTWYIFSNFYYDTMGGVAVLLGESGLIYCFGHIAFDEILRAISITGSTVRLRKTRWAYNDYVEYLTTLDHRGRFIKYGTHIGQVGDSGYSTGAHTHMQTHANKGDYNSRIDPAGLWPDVEINDNGAGPRKGTRDGMPRIVPMNLSLEYLRGETST